MDNIADKMRKEKAIAEEYKEFANSAREMAILDIKSSFIIVSDKKLSQRYYEEQLVKHIIGMIEMYTTRYGDVDERLRIVTYLENNLKPENKESKETWGHLKKQILSGEYKDLTEVK
jgi:hypothetical protein